MPDALKKLILVTLAVCTAMWLYHVGFIKPRQHRPPTHQGIEASQTFRMNLGTEPPTLDPARADDLVSMTVINNLMRGLVQYGPRHQIKPAVAERWTVSPDGKHYRFFLNPRARWSDGQPITAHDFVYAWRRVLDQETGSPYAFLLFDIKNAKAFYDGNLKPGQPLGFRALDDHTLDITMARPIAFMLDILAFSIALPQREDVIKTFGESWTEANHIVTNGPYTLQKWDHENEIVLKPNPRYWLGVPQNAGVQMLMIPEPGTSLMMYETGELDFVESPSSMPVKEVRRLKSRPDFHQTKLHAISYLGFNTQKPPFNDVRVRRAFAMAFDRTYIPQIFQGGEVPIKSWISPGLFGYNPKLGLPFNVAKARRLLAEAGYPGGKGFPKTEMWFANTTPENRQVAEIAQFQWQQNLGVTLDLKNVEWKVYLSQLNEDPPQLFRMQWFVDYPDPDSFMTMFIKSSGNNYTRWTHADYDRWVADGAISQNPKTRQALYDKAQRLLLEQDAVMIPVNVMPKAYLLNPQFTGFRLNELNLVNLDQLRAASSR